MTLICVLFEETIHARRPQKILQVLNPYRWELVNIWNTERAEKQSNLGSQHLKPWQMRWTRKSGHPVTRASGLGSIFIRNSSSGQDELAGKIRHCHQAWQPELNSQTHRWEERTNSQKLSSELYTVACVCVFVYVQCMCVPTCTCAHTCTYTYTHPCAHTQINV